jgi:hypothetical protein
MLINTCCSYESRIAYDLCPECEEHCDWEDLEEDEEEIQKDINAENKLEEEQINKQNK